MAQHPVLVTNDPAAYLASNIVARESAEQMIERLSWVKLQPSLILDLGCGPGGSQMLQTTYPAAKVISLDSSYAMLVYAKQHAVAGNATCADAQMLPFADAQFDLVYANFLLPWCEDMAQTLGEWQRVLRPGGLLVFTCLGPETLSQWTGIYKNYVRPYCVDMHHVGDALAQAGFADPVVDTEYCTLKYKTYSHLIHELDATAMLQLPHDFQMDSFEPQAETMRAEDGLYAVTYEIVQGHAWGQSRADDCSSTTEIPLSLIRKQLRRGTNSS